jgi:hypothetical protein
VAYIGFAGTLSPGEADQPIAICQDSILDDEDQYTCTIGRMINSGQQVSNSETGGWTSFVLGESACLGGTNAQEVRSLVCSDGNPDPIILGDVIATNGGEIQSAFNDLISCWVEVSEGRTKSWDMTLPVITCPGNNVGTCEKVVGAVNIRVVWITGGGEDPHLNDAPWEMDDWSSSEPVGIARWLSFVSHFNLQNIDGQPAPYEKKSIYFKPDCSPHKLSGRTGGKNFGILAKIPVLVK